MYILFYYVWAHISFQYEMDYILSIFLCKANCRVFKQIILLYILYILFPAHFTKLGLEVLSNLLPLSQTITVMNDRRRTFAYICLMMARTEYS